MSLTPEQLVEEFQNGFLRRKYSAALLLSFIDLLGDVGASGEGYADLSALLAAYPQVHRQANGDPAATLILTKANGDTVSLRRFYDAAQQFFREEHARYDFPTSGPYGSGKWRDYLAWWDALVTFSTSDLSAVRQAVVSHVLAVLPSQAFDPSTVKDQLREFLEVILSFDLTTKRGEPTGAPMQGLVFGFLRANHPSLHTETGKVRDGSKREGRVGDVDVWDDRGQLIVTAEAKHFIMNLGNAVELGGFAAEALRRNALGLVIALGFQEGVREKIESIGLRPMDLDDMHSVVELWDPSRQRAAISAMDYYFRRIEKKAALIERFDNFRTELAAGDNAPPASEQ